MSSNDLQKDFNDFLEHSLSGHATADRDGKIVSINQRLAGWLDATADAVIGKTFSECLAIGGRIYYETHLAPLLRMQGYFDEVAVELKGTKGTRLPVFMNAYERRDERGEVMFVRITVFRANDRVRFEQNLQHTMRQIESDLNHERDFAKLREQFIAVLGHDLRNPVQSIRMSASLLAKSALDETQSKLVHVARRSGDRMDELINNVMDFAKARMGDGISLDRREADIDTVITDIIDEIKNGHPEHEFIERVTRPLRIVCDPNRLAQLFSNLCANAVFYGAKDRPVIVSAKITEGMFEWSVTNYGTPIAPDAISRIFEPFTREANNPSKNGLGLGLFIASEIARAHEGKLVCSSANDETRFTLTMPATLSI